MPSLQEESAGEPLLVRETAIEKKVEITSFKAGALNQERRRAARTATWASDPNLAMRTAGYVSDGAGQSPSLALLGFQCGPGRHVDERIVHEVFGLADAAGLQSRCELHVARRPNEIVRNLCQPPAGPVALVPEIIQPVLDAVPSDGSDRGRGQILGMLAALSTVEEA